MPDRKSLFNPDAPHPPNLRPCVTGSACSGCTMFTGGVKVCWGYGNYPVEEDQLCDSFEPAEKTESHAERIEREYGKDGPPKGSDDDLRKRIASGDPEARSEFLKSQSGRRKSG